MHSTHIYDADIVNRLNYITAPDNRSLWSYANLHFQPRNAMMYRVVHEKDAKNLAVVGVNKKVLNEQGYLLRMETQRMKQHNFTTPPKVWKCLNSSGQ